MKPLIIGWALGLFLGAALIFHYVNVKILVDLFWGQRQIWVIVANEGTSLILAIAVAILAYKLGKEEGGK